MPIFVSVPDFIRSAANSGFLVKTIYFLPTLDLLQVSKESISSSDEFVAIQVFVYSAKRETLAECQQLVTQIGSSHHVLIVDESHLMFLFEVSIDLVSLLIPRLC